MGVSTNNSSDLVMQWYRIFHEKWAIIIPEQKKNNLPPFLDLNPDA
jgi:hypothetical protein